jgi:hypothetical protein
MPTVAVMGEWRMMLYRFRGPVPVGMPIRQDRIVIVVIETPFGAMLHAGVPITGIQNGRINQMGINSFLL